MKAKRILDLGPDNDFCMFGISCHIKDYRFCWLLNKQLDIKLRRVGDYYPIFDEDKKSEFAFPFYYCDENVREESFYLLGNHSPEGDLLEKYAQIDFVFLVHEIAYPGGPAGLVQEIRKIPQVLTAFEIKLSELKDKDALLSSIELCLLDHHKEIKKNLFPDINKI